MRVLIFTQYYPPEVGATQNRLHYFASSLAKAGHDVTVITEVPNHPAGIIASAFRGILWRKSVEDRVQVVRVWVKTAPEKTFWVRIAFYLTYAINATLAAFFLAGRHDVVFVTSPPLTVGVPALLYSRLFRVPYILDVRDLWPVLAVEMGEMSNRTVIALARRLELTLYRHAAVIAVVTRGFAEYMKQLGHSDERLLFLPNGTVPEVFHPSHPDEQLRATLNLTGRFVIGFYGNHGIAQGLEDVIDAAALLRDHPTVLFLFVGEGPVKRAVVDRAQRHGLTNVLFHPQVPQADVLGYISLADAVIVPLKNLDLFKTFIPSKLFDFMACAKPVLLQVDGEARQIVAEAGAGVFVPPGDPMALASAVTELAMLPADVLERMGHAGCAYVHKNYLREQQAAQLTKTLAAVAVSRA